MGLQHQLALLNSVWAEPDHNCHNCHLCTLTWLQLSGFAFCGLVHHGVTPGGLY